MALLLVLSAILGSGLPLVLSSPSHCGPCPFGPLDRRQPGHPCSMWSLYPADSTISHFKKETLCSFLPPTYRRLLSLSLATRLAHFLLLLNRSAFPSSLSALLTLMNERQAWPTPLLLLLLLFCSALHSTDSHGAACWSISSHSPLPLPSLSLSIWEADQLVNRHRLAPACLLTRSLALRGLPLPLLS